MDNYEKIESKPTTGMLNENKKPVEMLIPRKCNATNTILHANDKSSIQLNIGEVNEDGIYNGKKSTIVLCGKIRARGQADFAIDKILRERAIMPFKN